MTWATINNVQTPSWSAIGTAQTPAWTDISMLNIGYLITENSYGLITESGDALICDQLVPSIPNWQTITT